MQHKHRIVQVQKQCHVLLQSQLSLTSFSEMTIQQTKDLLDHVYHILPVNRSIKTQSQEVGQMGIVNQSTHLTRENRRHIVSSASNDLK